MIIDRRHVLGHLAALAGCLAIPGSWPARGESLADDLGADKTRPVGPVYPGAPYGKPESMDRFVVNLSGYGVGKSRKLTEAEMQNLARRQVEERRRAEVWLAENATIDRNRCRYRA